MNPPPVLTLLTDFGTDDTFVGVMKGVIHQRCAAARIVDLTHAIGAQDVRHGGYALADAWRYFPPGTIHVAVVDPGVGGDRRIIAARVGGHIAVAPDNGLLTAVFGQVEPDEVRDVNNGAIFLKSISRTFHGRDIFAPTAGALAAGMAFEDVGPPADDWLTLDLPRPIVADDGVVRGEVIHVDRFGNLITNMPGTMLPLLPRVAAGDVNDIAMRRHYGEAAVGELLGIVGSHGRLEIAVNGGSAATKLGVAVGAAVTAMPGRRG